MLKQILVEIDRQMELVDADILILPVHRGILLLVDVDGGKADHRVGKVRKMSCVRSCRKNERHRRGIV